MNALERGNKPAMTNDERDSKSGKAAGPQDGENHKERVDRELIELLNELRVALPGVQVLFAFLLTLPFTQSFGKLTKVGDTAYMIALISAAASTALFITPTSMHRLTFRRGDKEQLLFTANRTSIGGLALLLVAMVASVIVVVGALYGGLWAVVTAGGLGLWFVFFWYVLALKHRADHD